LRPIDAAAGAAAAEAALDAFEAGEWGRTFPTVVAAWRRAWTQVIPFLAVPPELRRVIHTTNAVDTVLAVNAAFGFLSIWLSVSACSLQSRTRRTAVRGPMALLDFRCACRLTG
jgi:hypothetical protein